MSKHAVFRKRASAALASAALLAAGLGLTALPAGADATPPVTTTPPTILCPQPAGNARFVRFAYFHILFRCPDAAGLAYWTTQLDHGMSTDRLTDVLDMSNENVLNNNVMPLYHAWLGRVPTAAEIPAAAAMIRSEEGDAELQAVLASSDEYYNTLTGQGSTPAAMDSEWLHNVYEAVLERAPDDTGIAVFGTVFGTASTVATRHTVFMALEHSAENAVDWVGSAYFASLGRPADPGGHSYWSNWLLSSGNWRTFRMATYLMSSAEGQAIAQTQPAPPPDGH